MYFMTKKQKIFIFYSIKFRNNKLQIKSYLYLRIKKCSFVRGNISNKTKIYNKKWINLNIRMVNFIVKI